MSGSIRSQQDHKYPFIENTMTVEDDIKQSVQMVIKCNIYRSKALSAIIPAFILHKSKPLE